MNMKKILLILAAALMSGTASAQRLRVGESAGMNGSTAVGRKKVAVVLSGGGAMGSIIGGLYSIGYSNRTKKPYFFLNLGYEF